MIDNGGFIMDNVSGRLEKETVFYENMENKLNELPDIFNEYYTSMRANRKSFTTIGVYINNALHFANFVTKGKMTEDFYKHITPNDVESYMISLETRKTKDGVKRTGDDILQARWSSLNTFFGWLVKRGYITQNPMTVVDRPKNNTEHQVIYLNKTEINKLFKAVEQNPNKVMALRDATLFSIAIATGLRASALTNINLEDIDWENGTISVVEKRRKIREIPIGENTQQAIKEWIKIRNAEFADVNSNALFLSQKKTRLSGDAANDALKKYCADAGIQKKITLHKLRASTATNLAASKVDLQTIAYILGHGNTAVTLRYTAILDENKKNAKDILDKLTQRR
jgi:site-specific recombinase XerD